MTLKGKIIALFSALLLSVLGLNLYLTVSSVREALVKENLKNLMEYSSLAIRNLQKNGIQGLQETAHSLGNWPGRITLIDLNGRVLYDSSGLETDNHLRRPEIIEATETGSGNALRYSSTLRTHLHYYAVSSNLNHEKIFVRIAYPISALTQIQRVLFEKSLFYLLWVGGIALLGWSLLTQRLFKPLESIVAYSAQVTEKAEVNFPVFKEIELQRLSDSLNTMSIRLKAANLDIQSRREELSQLVEALPVGIILLGENRGVRYLNALARQLLGEKGEVTKGSPIERLLPSAEIYSMLDAPDACRDFFLPYNGGTWVKICTQILGNGRLLLLRNLTEEHKLEETRRNFVIEASHDLQTPLTAIRAAAEILLEEEQGSNSQLLETILRQQERMTSLIDDLLLLVKLEKTNAEKEMKSEDLAALLEILLDDFRSNPAAKGVEFQSSLNTSARICGIRNEILRALSNILDNAVRKCKEKWGAEGSKILLSLSQKETWWILEIADNGPGIDSETEDRILGSLLCLNTHSIGKWGNGQHGLGLSISARIMQLHGGHIELLKKSSLGGVAFALYFPAEKSLEDASIQG